MQIYSLIFALNIKFLVFSNLSYQLTILDICKDAPLQVNMLKIFKENTFKEIYKLHGQITRKFLGFRMRNCHVILFI